MNFDFLSYNHNTDFVLTLPHHRCFRFHSARTWTAALWCRSVWSWCLDGPEIWGNTSRSAPSRSCWSLAGLPATLLPSFLIWLKEEGKHTLYSYSCSGEVCFSFSSTNTASPFLFLQHWGRGWTLTSLTRWGLKRRGFSSVRRWCQTPFLRISSGWPCGVWPQRSRPACCPSETSPAPLRTCGTTSAAPSPGLWWWPGSSPAPRPTVSTKTRPICNLDARSTKEFIYHFVDENPFLISLRME